MKICIVDGCPLESLPQSNKSRCRTHYNEYMKKYTLARYHRRRAEWIEKLGGICEVCGTTERLEFDHKVASEKEFDVSKMISGASETKLAAEMNKCHLLCHDHHVEKSISEGDIKTVNHGGGLTGKYHCQCDLCGPLKNAYNAKLEIKN